MKAAGIIAEYNPFHNGHRWQLARAKAETGADFIVAAMSGDFVQRGAPAMADKHTRAQMALAGGADLVLEIPAAAAVSSAEYFAGAGVRLLAKTGVVSVICYGCEQRNPGLSARLAEALLAPDTAFSDTVRDLLRKGKSYPFARQEALCAFFPDIGSDEIRAFVSSPNNILALEYEKAIAVWNRSHPCPNTLEGHAMKRVGSGYHSTRLTAPFASASAIRRALFDGPADDGGLWQRLSGCMPDTSAAPLKAAWSDGLLLHPDDFSAPLCAALLAEEPKGLARFSDVSDAMAHRIANCLPQFLSCTQFADLVKTKDLTHTRVSRALFHILLGITQEDCARDIRYLRVLGFRKTAAPLLSAIRKKASAPLITKVADASRVLAKDSAARSALNKDIAAADLYRSISSIKSGRVLPNEYRRPLAILKAP